ncbi:hypothetical protein TNCV_3964261 [Trichonephila clavipes]|nr:hypothetical protein TNCV_3964261 [Trichonephila clavipes]
MDIQNEEESEESKCCDLRRSLDSTRRFCSSAPRHRLIAVASLGRLPRHRSIHSSLVYFVILKTALSDRWRSLWHYVIAEYRGIRYAHPFLPSAIMTKHASLCM